MWLLLNGVLAILSSLLYVIREFDNFLHRGMMSRFIFPRLVPTAPIFLAIQLADLVVSLPPFASNPLIALIFFFSTSMLTP